jgi:hypothetical protein
LLINGGDVAAEVDSQHSHHIQSPHAHPSVGDNFPDSLVGRSVTPPILHPRRSPFLLLERLCPSMTTSLHGRDSHHNVPAASCEDCTSRCRNTAEMKKEWEVLVQFAAWSHVPLSPYLPATPAAYSETKFGPFEATYRVLSLELFEVLYWGRRLTRRRCLRRGVARMWLSSVLV